MNDLKEILLGFIFILIFFFAIFAMGYAIDKYENMPCEQMGKRSMRSVPARCYSYFIKESAQ